MRLAVARTGAITGMRTVLTFGLLLAIAWGILIGRAGRVSPGEGDAPEYLNAAYHLARHGTFSQSNEIGPVPPAIGREPGYATFLALLMRIDPAFGEFTPGCTARSDACPPEMFRVAGFANLGFIALTGLGVFGLAASLTGSRLAGLISAGYVLLNQQMNKGWANPMSDRLAVALLVLALLALVTAIRHGGSSRGSLARWTLVGAGFAALVLTKAVFLPYCILLALVGLAAFTRRSVRARLGRGFLLALAIWGAAVGGWVLRNERVSGEFRITDARGGISLSTRAVFDQMTAEEYAASFVYWTRGFGPGLAGRLFGADVVKPFDLNTPDGFYDRGANGYPVQVAALQAKEGLDYWAAVKQVDRQLVSAILGQPIVHFLTTFPLLYRGIWIDEFVVVGLPCFIWCLFHYARRRDWLTVTVLSTALFNMLFHAVFTISIPRYQMLSVPIFAISFGMAVISLVRRRFPLSMR
jgi:4-amino-4-deoxy-L-arabinose transferase-like glycosyltransferase